MCLLGIFHFWPCLHYIHFLDLKVVNNYRLWKSRIVSIYLSLRWVNIILITFEVLLLTLLASFFLNRWPLSAITIQQSTKVSSCNSRSEFAYEVSVTAMPDLMLIFLIWSHARLSRWLHLCKKYVSYFTSLMPVLSLPGYREILPSLTMTDMKRKDQTF